MLFIRQWSDIGAARRVRCWQVLYNAESTKQDRIKCNSITKTIHFAHIGILFIYGVIVPLLVSSPLFFHFDTHIITQINREVRLTFFDKVRMQEI